MPTTPTRPASQVVLKLRFAKTQLARIINFRKARLNARITVAGDILIPVYREHPERRKINKGSLLRDPMKIIMQNVLRTEKVLLSMLL